MQIKQGKSSFGHMAANTNQFLTVLKKSRFHKISPLNVFPLKFYVHCQFLVSARFQLLVLKKEALVMCALNLMQVAYCMAQVVLKKLVSIKLSFLNTTVMSEGLKWIVDWSISTSPSGLFYSWANRAWVKAAEKFQV